MATLSALVTQTAAAVLALPGGTKTRLASDFSQTTPVASGATGVQVRAWILEEVAPDSARNVEAARVEVVMVRRLAVAQSEQAYMAGDMVADMSALISHAFWEGLAAVREIAESGPPGINGEPELRGPLLIYSVLVDLALVP